MKKVILPLFLTLFATTLCAQEAEAETLKYDFWAEFIKMVTVLSGVIALLLITSWFLKRVMSQRVEQLNKFNAIKVIERRVLNPKAALYLIEVPGKKLVISESTAGINCITELPANAKLPSEESEGMQAADVFSFSQILKKKAGNNK